MLSKRTLQMTCILFEMKTNTSFVSKMVLQLLASFDARLTDLTG